MKIRSHRGHEGYFGELRRRLAQCPAVEHVESTPLTSSVVVWHDDTADLGSIAAYARERNLFSIDEHMPGWTVSDAAAELYRDLDREFSRLTVRRFDTESLFLVALVGAGIVQALRGQILAPATTMFWYALDTLRRRTESLDAPAAAGRERHLHPSEERGTGGVNQEE